MVAVLLSALTVVAGWLSLVAASGIRIAGKEICTNNQHRFGTWRLRSNTTKLTKSFYCCGWDGEDFLLNTTLCGTNKINGDALYWGARDHNTQSGGHACTCDIRGNSRFTVTPRESYEWIPRNCSLLPFNGIQFCKLLGNRTILMSGDSTMQQIATTLLSMTATTGGKCGTQIAMGRSDYLAFTLKGHKGVPENVNFVKPDICIMNAGAHQHDMGDIWDIWGKLEAQWARIHASSPHTKFIWKTQSPAHIGCDEQNKPYTTYHAPDAKVDQYRYGLFPEFDEVSANFSAKLGIKVLDISPLYLRPDAHPKGDCMHYCLPGPLDLFSNIFITMLYNNEI